MKRKNFTVFSVFNGCAGICLLLLLTGCANAGHQHQNRLLNASSPYLKDHADNPVDWYEWGNEAFDKAKKENKPLLISIGFSSCHWCHVMEKESFMDTAVARIMNENFVCISVDREERPDIDNIYTNTVLLLSGNSGWPLNAFTLPDGRPFFAGTYYSKTSWINLLLEIVKAYKSKPDLVLKQAIAICDGIAKQELINVDSGNIAIKNVPSLYRRLYDSIYKHSDLVNGGLIGAIKFPTPPFAEFMLQDFYTNGNSQALKAATTALDKMALGGIYDQLEGGFARYATDSLWRIPHFEKMLYDNGQMLSLYAHAYQVTKNGFYKKVLTETIAFIENNLAAPRGGYFSSLNADTDSDEGKYYAWNEKEFLRATRGEEILAEYFHVSTPGNWTATDNILYTDETPEEFAAGKKMNPAEFAAKLTTAKMSLLKERRKRSKPTVDSKIITSWNSILLKGYADAYAATGFDEYLEKALSIAAFIEKNQLSNDGSLKRSFINGKSFIPGFLDDYAFTAAAFIRLYEVSLDIHWMKQAKQVASYAVSNFINDKSDLFYYAQRPELNNLLRKTEIADDYIPSSNAVMAKVLYTLGIVYDDTLYTKRSLAMLSTVETRANQMPSYHIQWSIFAGLLCGKSYEVMILGKDAITKNKMLLQSYLPTSTFMGSNNAEDLPLLNGKLVENKTLIYVCTDRVCKSPVEEISKALEQLK